MERFPKYSITFIESTQYLKSKKIIMFNEFKNINQIYINNLYHRYLLLVPILCLKLMKRWFHEKQFVLGITLISSRYINIKCSQIYKCMHYNMNFNNTYLDFTVKVTMTNKKMPFK